jgi:hypothetical protein
VLCDFGHYGEQLYFLLEGEV